MRIAVCNFIYVVHVLCYCSQCNSQCKLKLLLQMHIVEAMKIYGLDMTPDFADKAFMMKFALASSGRLTIIALIIMLTLLSFRQVATNLGIVQKCITSQQLCWQEVCSFFRQ